MTFHKLMNTIHYANRIKLLLFFTLCLFSSLQGNYAQVSSAERQALIDFYNATDGASWSNNNNWLSQKPVREWVGVTVTNNKVTQISLNRNNLTGNIPITIGSLSALVSLSLEQNKLSGSIPVEIGSLISLTNLSLRWNKLIGSIPLEIFDLTSLTNLTLGGNKLTGSIPAEIGNLTSLTSLILSGTDLSGNIPIELVNLISLENLELGSSELTGSIPLEIFDLTSLTTLSLSSNQLTGTIPTEIRNLTSLEKLSLAKNQLTGVIPVEIGNLTSLRTLALGDNQLTGIIPVEIGNLTSLKSLLLANNKLTGQLPEVLGTLSKLQYLYIYKNQLSGKIPENFAAFSEFKSFQLQENRFVFSDLDPTFSAIKATIEANSNSPIHKFEYAPQNNLGEFETITVNEGSDIVLTAPYRASQFDKVQWYKDGVPIPNVPGKLALNNITEADAGVYYFTVTNSVVTELILERNPITLKVDGDSCGVSQSEKQALIDLYNSTDGANWTNNTNWLTDAPVCDWYGVTVVDGNVINLKLENNNLTGVIPTEIGDLINLKYLSLHSNNFTGNIPSEIGRLINLENLYLYQNNFVGVIPSEIGAATNLIDLRLYSNNFTGGIPTEIGNLINLKKLFLHNNSFTGGIPSEIGNLINLTQLYLYENNFSGTIPIEIGGATNLIELRLNDNSFAGSIPSEIGDLINLKYLSLYKNNFTGAIPSTIGNLTNLTNLDLYENSLSNNIPSEIGNLTNLRTMLLNDNSFTGNIPSEIGELINLNTLSLYENNLSGEIPSEVGNLIRLVHLDLSKNSLVGTIPSEIQNLSFLKHLDVGYNKLSDNILLVISSMNSLARFIFEDNSFVFSDFESRHENYSKVVNYKYIPQANVDEIETKSVVFGQSITLTSTALTSTNNSYQWYKDGIAIPNETSKELLISDASDLDAGDYYFTATNSIVTDLILTRNPITLRVEEDTCGVSESEKLALWDLYVSTNGNNWTNTLANNQPWDLNISVCDWYGVTVVDGEVTALNLENNAIQGTIPSSISNLLHLTSLELNTNVLTGELPSSMGALLELTYLSIHHNGLTGVIPSSLGSLSNLVVMDLSFNTLQGYIPVAFCNLLNLENLNLSDNQLSGGIPKQLGILKKLKSIDLRNNSFTGPIPFQLRGLFNLEFLAVSNNQLSGAIPFTVSEFSKLEEFVFENNRFIFSNFETKHLEYVSYLNTNYQYIPQAKTDAIETKTVTTNNSITLTTVLSSENNSYQWYKDGVAIVDATSSELIIENASITDTGIYYFTATNSIIADLTLERNLITLTVKESCVIPDVQREALITIYNTLGGENWLNTISNNQPWGINDINSSVCDWYGVVIEDNTVVELDLEENNLIGIVPDVFLSFSELENIILSSNTLGGNLPVSLTSLTNLERLEIQNNTYVFSDITPVNSSLSNQLGNAFIYEPQAKVDVFATESIAFGDTIKLTSTKLTDSNNEYQWYKFGLPIEDATSKEYIISNASLDDNGMYFFAATNTVATGLTLERNPIKIEVQAEGDTCGVPEADKQILIDLYTSTDGANWTNNTNWLTDAPVCEWFGVTVVDSEILVLNLQANNLSGIIPAQLGLLNGLTRIFFNKNQLSGTIPKELGNLSNLEALSIKENSLTGSIPKELGNLKKLLLVSFFKNNLSGAIPQELGNLTSLQTLDFRFNKLSGKLPNELGDLINLETFYIQYNELVGAIPQGFSNLEKLRIFNIHNNNFEDRLPHIKSQVIQSIIIDDNNYVFSDFENEHLDYVNRIPRTNITLYKYVPQAKVDEVETKSIVNGQSITLTSNTLSSTNNLYQWYKDGLVITGATDKEYSIESVANTDAGVYHFIATNSIITDLTLERNPITLEVKAAGTCDVSQEDRQALIDFYQTTNGDGWTNTTDGNQAWLINDPSSKVCDWFGVTVSVDYKIEGIQLQTNNLRGEIPTSLAVLDDLKVLELAQNSLIGELPASLGTLSSLQTLNLRENILVGVIPAEIFNATSLQTLDLGLNRLLSVIPEAIGDLQNLVYLDLSENKLEGTVPESLYTILTLEAIKLQKNSLRGGVSEAIENLEALQTFWLSQNRFSGAIPQSIAAIPGLYSIHLDFNSFGSDLPVLIPNFNLPSTDVQINNNGFVFSDFESEHPDYRDNLTNYTYIPQARVDNNITIVVELGGIARLFTEDLTSLNNTYRWYKDGDFLQEITERELSIDNITEADLGVYYFTATNSTIEGLTLERNRITLQLKVDVPDDGDCDILKDVADGSFEKCFADAGIIGTTIQNNDLSCSSFDTPGSLMYTWKVDENIQQLSSEITKLIESSPDGGAFASCRVYQPQSTNPSFFTYVLQKQLNGLEIGVEYEILFYQSNGGYTGATSEFNASWNVSYDNALFGGGVLSPPMLVKGGFAGNTSEAPAWDLVKIKFTATAASTTLKFSPSLPRLNNVDNGVLMHLLIDGIKVNKVDGDCGDSSEVTNFCLGNNTEEYPIVFNLIPHGDTINWYLTETGGTPLSDDTFISEEAENPIGVTYWWDDITDSISARTPSLITISSNVPVAEEYQSFPIGMQATISNLQVEGDNILWYDHPVLGTPLSLTTVLEDFKSYYAQEKDGGSCRTSVVVLLETTPPIGNGYQSFCDGATLADIVLDIMDGSTIVWYNQDIDGRVLPISTTLLQGETYYASQVDMYGVESESRKEVTTNVITVSPPYVPSTLQRFYANQSHTIGDLLAVGYNIRWFDQETRGIAYSNSEELIDGEIYYADQESKNGCSGPRQGVQVRILDEDAPILFGCEKFKPAIGDRYVINAWVREQGVDPVNPETRPFNGSEESKLFVGLLNHLKEKAISTEADFYHFPDVYIPESNTENLDFDALMAYVKDTQIDEQKIKVYGFRLEQNNYGHVIGFSFALNRNRTANFKYLTPKVRKSGVTLNYRYPLRDNAEDLTLTFKDISIEADKLIIVSDFKMENAGLYDTALSSIRDNDSGFSGIQNEITVYEYQEKEDYQPINYVNTLVQINYINEEGEVIESESLNFEPKGPVIDGWQKVSGLFTIPIEAFMMKLSLMNTASDVNAYFDDIRFQPYSSSMKTFVYDPVTQRLKAELDENNFATYYEYDQEGGLIRVKKETERGIYTIQETRSGNSKLNNSER